MKKLFTILAALLSTATLWAQSPEKISYQAIIRNGNALITDTQVGMQISILHGSASGAVVYVETQTPATNANGLLSIEIGNGTVVSGDFATIDWANGLYFIKTETDPTGSTSYTITGTSQLLSVPYALHAKTAETVTGTISETDPTYTGSQAANISASDIANLVNLSGTNTGDQDISALAAKTALGDSTALLRSEIPDVSGLATTSSVTTGLAGKVDTEAGKVLSTNDYTTAEKDKLGTISGTNTGDQDISALASKTALGDSTALLRSEIPDVSGLATTSSVTTGLAGKVDTEAGKVLSTNDYTTAEKDKLGAISGTNTGDQDISGIAINTQAIQDTAAQLRADIPMAATYRWATFSTYDQYTGWACGNDARLFGGVNPSSWTDGNSRASHMSADKEVLRTLLIDKGYAGKNAMIMNENWMSYSSTNGKVVIVLFRIHNNTSSDINWVPYFHYSAYGTWGETASVALNGVDKWYTVSSGTASTSLSIPANRVSTVIFVSTSGVPNSSGAPYHGMRNCRLAFFNNSLELPSGLEFIDDLDTAQGGWEQ